MERLTKMIDGVPCYIGAHKRHDEEIAAELSIDAVREALLRLAEYEDTGLTPEQIREKRDGFNESFERLTYRNPWYGSNTACVEIKEAGSELCKEVCDQFGENGCTPCPINKAFEKLALYEDSGFTPEEVHELSEVYVDNRLYILPCHIGDTLYRLDEGKIYKVKVRSMRIHEEGVTILYHFNKFGYVEGSGVFGKTLFLTKEDAEEKRRENHEEA